MNLSRDEYVATIKSAFVSTATRLAQTWLAVQVPFTAGPIISVFVEYTLGRIFEGIADEAELHAFFLYIDMRGVAQGRRFGEAARNLKAAQATKNPVAIKQAEDDVIETLRDLISFTN